MMWKDSYRLGVDRIDNQHMELFRMTDDLVNAVKNGANVEAVSYTHLFSGISMILPSMRPICR